MTKKIWSNLLFILFAVIVVSTNAFAGTECQIVFKNGDLLSGTIQNKNFSIKTAYGTMSIKTPDIAAIQFGDIQSKIELKSGDKLTGVILEDTINFKLAGKTDITVKKGDAKAIMFADAGKASTKDVGGSVIENSIGMKFKYISPGSFMMGSPRAEEGRSVNEVQHKVTLSKGFYIQTTEVTQAQWYAVMGNNPSKFSNCGGDCPVEQVSWDAIQGFIDRLMEKERGKTYRLPTEAEWEYACRAGSKTAYYYSDDMNSEKLYTWFYDNSGDKTHPVAQKKPNAWGLYDMYGNVWEWCQDWYGDYPPGAVKDPQGPEKGSYRVYRGGGWYCDPGYCRSANRYEISPGFLGHAVGFRLVLLPGQ